jgi:hypothetical protein
MATDKKHIAVYLDPAVEQALIAFCEQKGLISKKGFMYSAGVNAALAEFFGIADTEAGNIPQSGNILSTGHILESSNIPATSPSNIPTVLVSNIPATYFSNIPTALASNISAESVALEVLSGKLRA